MAYSKRELLEEIARRRGLDTKGGAMPVVGNPQGPSAAGGGSAPPSLEAIQAEQVAIQLPGIQDSARSLLRGATLGLSDKLGAAVASLPTAMKQLQVGYQGPTVGEAYSDIKGTIDFEAEEASAAAPGVSELLEGVGVAGTIGATGLPGATAAALKRGAARVGLGGAKGSSAARGATTKPRFTAAQVAAGEHLPKAMGRTEATVKAAGVGALLDDEAIEGAGIGAAAMNLLFNTPMGRLFTLAMARKSGAGALTTAAWHGMNRQNRRAMMDMFKSFSKKGAK